MNSKPLPQFFNGLSRQPFDLQEFRYIYLSAENFVARLVAKRIGTSYVRLKNREQEKRRRAAYLAERTSKAPHEAEALILRKLVRDTIGTRPLHTVGKNLAQKLVCNCKLMHLECLNLTNYIWSNRPKEEQENLFGDTPIIYETICSMLMIVSQQDISPEFLTDFHKALDMQNFDLPVVGEDSETDLDWCMFARRLYHNIALSYNSVLGLTAPDADCEEIDFCPNTSRTKMEFSGNRVNFSEHALN